MPDIFRFILLLQFFVALDGDSALVGAFAEHIFSDEVLHLLDAAAPGFLVDALVANRGDLPLAVDFSIRAVPRTFQLVPRMTR